MTMLEASTVLVVLRPVAVLTPEPVQSLHEQAVFMSVTAAC